MPRAGGTYSLPAGYEAVSGEVATASQHNQPLEDIAEDLNTARPIVAGGTGATSAAAALTALGAAALSANTFTGIQRWDKGADLASASSVTIGTDGNYFDITGTTTITAFSTVTIGTWILVQFDGALTLTHNASSFKLPGGANITTAAGDHALFVSEGSGNWRCAMYMPYGSPPLILIDEDDMSTDSATRPPSQQSAKAYKDRMIRSAQTGTSYTLVLGDAGKGVSMADASANTLTIPTNSSVAFPIHTVIVVVQRGAGTTTIAGDTGVTVNGVSGGSGDITSKWQAVTLWKVDTDEWYAMGSIGTVS